MHAHTTGKNVLLALLALAATLGLAACGGGDDDSAGGGGSGLSGSIQVDGSSTVGPLTTLAAERFQEENSGVNVTVGVSGTGGGFERFCNGETDVSNASRAIKDEEAEICEQNGIEFTEFEVATDAITVIANAQNDWVDCLTVEQLAAIWGPGSKVDNWSDVEGGDYPDESLVLAGPGTDSGTFDYFTDEVNGEEGASRSDYTASEDDNVVVQAVSSEEGGLGYLGYTYYEENAQTLKALAIDGGEGCVEPSVESAQSGEYSPLARSLLVYVKNESMQKPHVAAFMRFYAENIESIAQDARYIPLSAEAQQELASKVEEAAGA